MMLDEKKLNEEQLKNVAGGMGSIYDLGEEWIVHGDNTKREGIMCTDYERDGEWVMGKS
ncbi:MAG: hypothetical protein IKS17_07475 [Firmicutes bacterium]|nr:hypothetical protein [Bacillota bacterium]